MHRCWKHTPFQKDVTEAQSKMCRLFTSLVFKLGELEKDNIMLQQKLQQNTEMNIQKSTT